tara:strand:- start:98 stop:253 length:156 start_codon:yes stop_codon:yes gene_type:complete
MAILYRHIRLDTNEPFYIGIGKTTSGLFERTGHKKYPGGLHFSYDFNTYTP